MIIFNPQLSWPVIFVLGGLGFVVVLAGLRAGARGAILRLAGFAVLLAIIAGPEIIRQTTRPLPDIALVVVDNSASMNIGNRAAMAAKALANLQAQSATIKNLELRVVNVPEAEHGGTALFAALASAMADIAPQQLAGIVALTDGQIADPPATWNLPAPLTALLTASAPETDRELRLISTPGYGLVDKNINLRLEVFDHGVTGATAPVMVRVAEDGSIVWQGLVPVGQVQTIAVPVRHAGPAVITASAATLPGAVTAQNSTQAFSLNGITKKLEVLLISGNPNQSERSWRLLLKSDPAVELVHFTILRTPGESMDAPPENIALVPFPVAQLFGQDITKFNLIILDEFDTTGLLPPQYLQNMAAYVQAGGALLVQVGPEFEGPDSLAQTPLATVLPALPAPPGTLTAPFAPRVTAIGARHPVTAPFAAMALAPWQRLEAASLTSGDVLMSGGADNWPLLVLADEAKGRVGMLLSDQFWLWSRGAGHAGPALPLLRQVVHWLLREPALEAEFLTANIQAGQLQIRRRTLAQSNPGDAVVTKPDGTRQSLILQAKGPGLYQGALVAATPGVWQVNEGGLQAYAVATPVNAQEFQNLAASGKILALLAHEVWLGRASVPPLRDIIHPRHAVQVTGTRAVPMVPPFPAMLVAVLLLAAAWWRERG